MPEWAARQLLHPEERRGEGREGRGKGREGGREGWKEGGMPAGRRQKPGAAVATSPRGRAVTPSRSPLSRGRENPVGKRRGGKVDRTERAWDWDTDKLALG